MYKTQLEQQFYILVELSDIYIHILFTAARNGGRGQCMKGPEEERTEGSEWRGSEERRRGRRGGGGERSTVKAEQIVSINTET